MGWPGLFVAALGVSATAAFIPAFKLTSIANVSLIYASAPFLAAGIAWIWYRERIEFRVIMAALAAAFGVAVVVSGSLGKVNFVGDALALWMTLMLSTIVVIYRRHPQTPAAGPNVAASLLLLPIALLLINPLASPRQEILVLAAFGLLHAIASVTLSEGARRLPPSEAALISSLETPLAILWGWALLAERPAIASIIGGGLILLAVFGSQLPYLFRKNRRDP